MFDVKTMLTEEAQKSWTSGKWAGKITVHDMVEHLKTLGRLATTEDIDAYVATTKTEDLDVPMKRHEIKERFKGAKRLDDMPLTRAALRWLREQRVNGREANMDFQVWKTMKTRANVEGRQLDLALVQALFATATKVIAVKASGPDTTVLDYAVGGTFTCSFDGCACQSVLRMSTLTDPNGEARKHESGPLTGKDFHVGDWLLKRGGDSRWEAQPLCREHSKMAVQAGNTTYPYGDASVIADTLNADEAVERDNVAKA
ncbi:MAG: hypothetical protein Q8L24_02020, partial [bacterium]|nr:hypothetical protein [bacterium]